MTYDSGHLTGWFLVKVDGNDGADDDSDDDMDVGSDADTSQDPSRQPRQPLPEDNIFADGHVVYGYLALRKDNGNNTAGSRGKDAGPPPNRLAVRIADASIWTIDRTPNGRGLWVHSPRGCYKLLEPDDQRVPVSQADLHLYLRARFGLLSNLLDLMSEPYNNNANNYVPVHARRSPANIHALLSPNEETYKKFHTAAEPLNREPFDLELLERCPEFVRRHLLHYHPLLHEGCAFMKRLTSMMTEKEASLVDEAAPPRPGPGQRRPWTREDYLRSATEAERRGQRTPWGDALPDAKPIKPNRLIDIEIRNAARGAAISYKNRNSPEGKRASVAAAQPAAPKIPFPAAAAMEMTSIPKKTSGEEPEDGEIYERKDDRRAAQGSMAGAMITPTPPSKGAGHPPPPPVQQNFVPRAPRRSPDGPSRPSKSHGFPPIFIMTSSGRPQFSSPSMVQAIRFFSPYLTPVPQDDDLSSNFVDYQRYSIRPDKIWSFIDNILQNSSVLSLEAMLLSADCFGRGSAEMSFKCLLTKKGKEDAISPLQTLFVVWPDHVLQMADQTCRCTTAPGTGRMQGQTITVDNSKRPEVMTAVAIMNLVRRFGDCIRTAEQLEELKFEFGVDWYDLCSRAIAIAKRHNLDSLGRACHYARAQLDNIKVVQGYETESLLGQLTVSASQMESAPNSEAKSVDSAGQSGSHARDQTPQQTAASPLDYGPRRVSALDLPDMEKKDWMLKPPKYHQCKFFQRLNFCKNGPECRYAHVYRPPYPLPKEVPTETLLHMLYAERNISLTTRDLVVVSAPGADGKVWCTAALRCPIDQTIYYATGGVNGHLSNQGVYFYPSPREAIAAVAGIAVLAMKNEEELQEYGLLAFPSTYMQFEAEQQQQPSRQPHQVAEPAPYVPPQRHVANPSDLTTHAPPPPRQASKPTTFSFSELVPPSERVRQQQSVDVTEAPAIAQDASFVQILEPAHKKMAEPAEASQAMQTPAISQEEQKKPESASIAEQKKQTSDSAVANAAVAKWTSISRKAELKPKTPAHSKEDEKKSLDPPSVGSRITVEDAELLNSPLLERIRLAQESQQAGRHASKLPNLEDTTATNLWPEGESKAKAKKVAAAATAAAFGEANSSAIDEKTKAEAVKAALKERAKAEKAAAKAAKAAAKAKAKQEAEEKKRLKAEKEQKRLDEEAQARAASIEAKKKKSTKKKTKEKADKPKAAKKARKESAAAVPPAILRPPEIERRKPRQSLFSKLPPRRLEYHGRKSAKRPSSGIPTSSTAVAGENSSETGHMEIIPYWDTLGSCRLDPSVFHWANPANGSATSSPNPFGYDKKLGRAYYSSFVLHGKQYNVGDYIVRSEYDGEDIFRIVGAFQATKSFLGRWGGGHDWEKQNTSEEIQKRGHPYILTVPLVTKASLAKAKPGRKRKAADFEEEIVIGAEHGSNIFPLPQWLGEAQAGGYRKIRVRVCSTGLDGTQTEFAVGDDAIELSAKAPKKGKKGGRGATKSQYGDMFVCKEAVVPEASTTVGLNTQQFELLTSSPDTLLNGHIPDLWDSRFKATQVQMINRERSMDEDIFGEGKEVQFQYTGQSSDDSDSFDDEESGGEESDMGE